MTYRLLVDLQKAAIALMAAVALTVTLTTPQPAQAKPGEAVAVGIIGLAIYCGATGKCTNGKRSGTAYGSGDAIGLNRQNAMLVQGGLQNLGFYTGAIDGAIGAGTRNSIRAYQAAVGADQTGLLTGRQINDLVALSPSFASYPANDPRLFTADLARDLDQDGVRQLQAALNQQGYPAGAVDGALGNQTRTAIATYKATQGLPGQPVASRRVLARLQGWAPPEPAGQHILNARRGIAPAPAAVGVPQPQEAIPLAAPAPAATSVAVSAGDLTFDILGLELGMTQAQVKGTLMAQLGGELMFDQADAATIGAEGVGTLGLLTVQPTWPAAPAEQVLTLFDDTRPDRGALAIFRMIRMPDSVDQATFETQVLPDILANYGSAGMHADDTLWIGRVAARGTDNTAACGDPRLSVDTAVSNALAALWRSGGGPRLDGGLDNVAADCGQVLSVDYVGSVLRIGLWDTSGLAGMSPAATTPKLKF